MGIDPPHLFMHPFLKATLFTLRLLCLQGIHDIQSSLAASRHFIPQYLHSTIALLNTPGCNFLVFLVQQFCWFLKLAFFLGEFSRNRFRQLNVLCYQIEAVELMKLSVRQLYSIARRLQVPNYKRLRKAELISQIQKRN